MIWLRKKKNGADVWGSIPASEVNQILKEVDGAREIPFVRLSMSHIFINAIHVPDDTKRPEKFNVEEHCDNDLRHLTSKDLNMKGVIR